MAKEIEKKFLVTNDSWRQQSENPVEIRQGYLANTHSSSIRVRIVGASATLNIKSAAPTVTREEYEYNIPLKDAEEIAASMCANGEIVKTRHHIPYSGKLWEIDEFHKANAGLVVAEVELEHENEPFEKPPWLGFEVSHLPRYYNPNLVVHPYSCWEFHERQET